MLNRPFIYNRENLQNALVRDQINIRNNLIKRFRDLKADLNRILDKSGKIIQVQVVVELNKQSESGSVQSPDGTHTERVYDRASQI